MDAETIQTLMTGAAGLIGALGGSGLIYWRAVRKQKDAEASKSTTEAQLAEADLAEKILEKFQRSVLDRMDAGDSVRKKEFNELSEKIERRFDVVESDNNKQNTLLADIVEYLNGDFREFEKKKSTKQKSKKS